ncbi:MAG: hypothetical protein LBB75_01670 [Oscillospiraceae bacterium]|jgi:hypothetical protein|nr:hypothetical protein [Oscillospiraceae bacterium]
MSTISCVIRFIISAAMSVAMSIGGWLGLAWQGCATPLKDLSQLELSNGNRILLERGVVTHAWVPADDSDSETPPADDLARLGYGPSYYDGRMFNLPLHTAYPEMPWGMGMAPGDALGRESMPPGGEWLSPDQLRYIDTLESVCFGDEQEYSAAEAQRLRLWFADFRDRHPGVLLHSNQWAYQWSREQYQEYLRVAQPDMLTFDTYYFDERGSTPDCGIPALVADAVNYVRIPALGGYDGSGRSPIPFGQYLLGFKPGYDSADRRLYEITESQKHLVANLTLAMGGKWLNNFRIIMGSDIFLFYDADGRPTRHFAEYQKINEEVAALSPHLVKLQTTDVRVLPGRHRWYSLEWDNQLPKTVNRFDAGNAFLLKDISVKNTGNENGGLPGDVYVGYFAVLPDQSFESGKARRYFAVCNGLTSGNGKTVEEQHGSCAETTQEITLKLKPSDELRLYAVNAETGATEEVTITDNRATFSLGGGNMRLLYWE